MALVYYDCLIEANRQTQFELNLLSVKSVIAPTRHVVSRQAKGFKVLVLSESLKTQKFSQKPNPMKSNGLQSRYAVSSFQ